MKKYKIKDLISKLNFYTKAYDEGKPLISDAEWDKMYFELKSLEEETGIIYPDSPTQSILYDVQNELVKVKHDHLMLSLDKTKDWNEFLDYFKNKDVVGMLKLDGLTCSLKYKDGVLISAHTRGNGEIGEDILHNAMVINNIPKQIPLTEELILDGEIISSYKDFEEFSKDYSNPRNFAAGSIRLLDPRECQKRNLRFVAWNVVSNNWPTVVQSFTEIENLGFEVVSWTSSWDWDAKEFLIEEAERAGYPIDGLVGRFDDVAYGSTLGNTDHHSRAAYAFKFFDEVYESELIDIEWSAGRTGVLTPVAIFEPVEIDGAIIERASLHNLDVMEELLEVPYVGQKLRIFRANMIIPQIHDADGLPNEGSVTLIEIPNTCPICGEKTLKVKNCETHELICSNPNCAGKLINRLDFFVGKKGLDIKGLSKATLEKLLDWGWINSLKDIFELKNYRNEWIKKAGFGVKSVDNILNAIETSRKCDLDKFICALGIPLIGSVASKALVERFDTWDDFQNAILDKFDFSKINNFGTEMSRSLLSYDYNESNEIVNNYIDFNKKEEVINQTMSDNISGKIFVITGKTNVYKNREELKIIIEANGGKVSSAVSSKTNYLINNDIESTSSKNKTAKSLNIPIITEEDFLKMLK